MLIDEIDRADSELEAFLLEFLGEGSLTIPELGTITAHHRPVTILTSNRTRDLHDALARRCLYHWIDFPDMDRTARILRRSVPASSDLLVARVAALAPKIRGLALDKPPGLAEVIDWLKVLTTLGVADVDDANVVRSVGALAKSVPDRQAIVQLLSRRTSRGEA